MDGISSQFKSTITEFLSRPHLSVKQRLYSWLSASVSLAAEDCIRFFIALSISNFVPALHIKEVILQNYLFCGFPNSIEGLIILKEILTENELNDANYVDVRDEATMLMDGEELCEIIYGKNFDKLTANMKGLSTDLHQWMLREGYGKVLSRPVLNPLERELCTVSSLAALGRERQLISHIRGAVNVGAHEDEVREAIFTISPLVALPVRERAQAVLKNTIG
jgi:4-carboxymuconolactone decarboxylase